MPQFVDSFENCAREIVCLAQTLAYARGAMGILLSARPISPSIPK